MVLEYFKLLQLQVAPFNLLFGGANATAIRLVCCLAQVQINVYKAVKY